MTFVSRTRTALTLVLVACAVGLAATPSYAYDKRPVKLALSASAPTVDVGSSVAVQVTLLDEANEPVDATQAFSVDVDIVTSSGTTEFRGVTIDVGKSTGDFTFTAAEAGTVEFRADHKSLLAGGMVLGVREAETSRRSGGDSAVMDDILRLIGDRELLRPKIELRYKPERKLLADGSDEALVYAIVSEQSPPPATDIQIQLHNSDGELTPNPLVIARGEYAATARLRSQRAGTVTVEYLRASPAVDVLGKAAVAVQFGPPITRLELIASPRKISLVDSAQFVARLTDQTGTPLATDQERRVSLFIEQGSGQLSSAEILIRPGEAEGRGDFRPNATGSIVISAATTGMLPASVELSVGWPLLAIALALVGGLAGGWLAHITSNRERPWRILVGLVTGVVAYAAAMLGLLEPIAALNLPHPFVAIVVSVAGGWLGIGLLDWLLKRLGLSDQASRSE